MPKRRRTSNPLAAWSRVALRTSQMLLDSAEVIAHRSARMASAGVNPHPHDRREFSRMGTEKVEAALECAGAAARHALQDSWSQSARMWHEAWRIGADLTLLATSTTPAQALDRQARVMQGLARSATTDHATSSALAFSDLMLAPLQRRTSANVKRLRRAQR